MIINFCGKNLYHSPSALGGRGNLGARGRKMLSDNILFSFAFRNIFRNRERTFLTLSAIAFGTAAMILSGGFVEDAIFQLREGYIRGFTGHLQLYRKGFNSEGAARPFD